VSHNLSTKLTVPADLRFLEMVRSNVRQLASVAGFSKEEILGLELAVEEASVNIIEHAYPDGGPGDIFLTGEIGPAELVLSIRDEGLPFDPASEGGAGRVTIEDEFSLRGVGLKIIHHEMDEVHFENLGRQGKVLRLVKRLSSCGEPEAAPAPPREKAPPQSYEVRPMRPDDAVQVTRLFWMTYGYSYKNENFYRPEGLLHLIDSGRVASTVAVAENGEVVGHVGLLRAETAPIAEAALLVVSPAHRGRGIMEALGRFSEESALRMGLLGISADPVTSHAVSQREAIRGGWRPCGLELAACPPRLFKALKIEGGGPQRESYLHCFRYLDSPPALDVHVPARHREMISAIYDGLQQPCTLGEPAPAALHGEYRIGFDRTLLKAVIRVIRSDQRQWPVLLRAAVDLLDYAGAEVVDLDLPLAQPATALLCELAETAGFFFVGVRPGEAEDGDSLRLQRLNCPFDSSRLSIYKGFATTLFEYVMAAMGRAGKEKGCS
jgi:anti-sigma regulatory factor (Ser/Thr protein kinase)/GNAT superfamily N-acetyltransferase